MVIRRVESAARAVPGRRSLVSSVLPMAACLWMVAVSPSQQPAGAVPPAAATPPPAAVTAAVAPQNPAATPPAATAPVAMPTAVVPTFGRILVDQVTVRCWSGAVAQPPVFEDTLGKDQVIAVGRSENGFRAIELPLGPVGFVSRKFTEASPEGLVKTKGSKVAFRYRPRSSEAPVSQLPDATALHVLSEQDDWYRVRVAGVEAWVAEAEVQVGNQADPALATAYAELKQKHEAEVSTRLDGIKAQLARAAQDQIDVAAVQMVHDAFAAELKKPVVEQKFEPLNETLDKLAATLAADSAGRAAIDSLKKRIETQSWIAEATILKRTKAPVVDGPPAEKKDQLERFQSIGWLRYEGRLASPGIYFLEKGGQRQYLLSCNTGRYDMALFVDCEVGVIGPRRRPDTESLSVLDVERLEVLGTSTK